MQKDNLRRELTIAAVAFGIGFFILPVAIYWVGQRIIGEYAPEAGALTLSETIWTDLLNLQPAAWLLAASPYLVFQLLRLMRRLWRGRSRVNPVTNLDDQR